MNPLQDFAVVSPVFALVAGEDSGDLLGAELIGALKVRFPHARFVGIGGPRMVAAGLDAWHASDELSVMGLVEVLKHLPRLLKLRADLAKRFLALKPDCFIGIDAPDFNLGLEKTLKLAGIRCVHYVSPSVWAWREQRAARIARSADLVLCLFPMEPAIYARYGVKARFVGHPLADEFELNPDRAAARRRLEISDKARVLALMPGSRLSEIARLGDLFARSAQQAAHALPGLKVIAPMANAACRDAFSACLDRNKARGLVTVYDGQAHTCMVAADTVLLASGTAALEAMLAKRAMVVAYKIAPLSYLIVRLFGLMRTKHFALPNILAGEGLVPELMQGDATAEALTDGVLRYLRDPAAAAALAPRFAAIHQQLKRDASNAAADAVAALLQNR